jgi:hypothetical protein
MQSRPLTPPPQVRDRIKAVEVKIESSSKALSPSRRKSSKQWVLVDTGEAGNYDKTSRALNHATPRRKTRTKSDKNEGQKRADAVAVCRSLESVGVCSPQDPKYFSPRRATWSAQELLGSEAWDLFLGAPTDAGSEPPNGGETTDTESPTAESTPRRGLMLNGDVHDEGYNQDSRFVLEVPFTFTGELAAPSGIEKGVSEHFCISDDVFSAEVPAVESAEDSAVVPPDTEARVRDQAAESVVPEQIPASQTDKGELEGSSWKEFAMEKLYGMRAIVCTPEAKVTAASAAGGAVALGAAGGLVGLTAGVASGSFCGLLAAPFTFGLSIPFGAAVGGGAGACVGTTAGSGAGLVSGGAAGYCGYKLVQSRTQGKPDDRNET